MVVENMGLVTSMRGHVVQDNQFMQNIQLGRFRYRVSLECNDQKNMEILEGLYNNGANYDERDLGSRD